MRVVLEGPQIGSQLEVASLVTLNCVENYVPLIFTAAVCRDGTVRDLHGQELKVEEMSY